MAYLFANSGDPDQMLHSVASDLGLYCLPITLFWGASRQEWVKKLSRIVAKNILIFSLLYFRKIRFGISCESGVMQIIHMKCQALFSLTKNTKEKKNLNGSCCRQ